MSELPAQLIVAVGSDHAGFNLKGVISEHLAGRGARVIDLGTHSTERVDFPEFGVAVARAVASGEANRGVAICGTGIGICMAADKIHGIRAGTVHDETSARLARQHNDANVICMGARLIGESTALACLDAWLDASFLGGRYERRNEQLGAL